MNEILASQNTRERTSRVKKKRKQNAGTVWRTLTYSLLTVVVWGGLAYGGYTLAEDYIHQLHNQQAEIESRLMMKIEEVRSDNKVRFEELNSELVELTAMLESVSGQLESIREELELTSDSISGSDDTKLALQAQISALDKQLEELRKSLEKLEHAARVY